MRIHGHECVWGSYFHKGAFRWGYADDHSLVKGYYYTGATGRAGNDAENAKKYGIGAAAIAAQLAAKAAAISAAIKLAPKPPPAGERAAGGGERAKQSEMYGESATAVKLDKEKLQEALRKEELFQKTFNERDEADDRKRKYTSMGAEVKVSLEEMEAYRIKKNRGEDDMSKIGSDELLEYK